MSTIKYALLASMLLATPALAAEDRLPAAMLGTWCEIGKVEKAPWAPHTVRIYNHAPDISCKPNSRSDWLRITPTHIYAFEDKCHIATIERWREHGRERFKVLSICSFGDNEYAKWSATFGLETNGPTKSVNHKWLSLNVEEDD